MPAIEIEDDLPHYVPPSDNSQSDNGSDRTSDSDSELLNTPLASTMSSNFSHGKVGNCKVLKFFQVNFLCRLVRHDFAETNHYCSQSCCTKCTLLFNFVLQGLHKIFV